MVLGNSFYKKLLTVASNVGMKPEHLLNVMAVESGLNPAAHNKNGNASGLVQFMPETLKGLGFQGTHEDFRKLSGEEQLDYVEKFIKGMKKLNGGPFTSSVQYYIGNFIPAALQIPGVRNNDPNTIIVSKDPDVAHIPGVSVVKERLFYRVNAGLDFDKDGNITYGDIQSVLSGAAKAKPFQTAVSDLNKSTGYTPELFKRKEEIKKSPDLNDILNNFLHMIAASDKISYKGLPKNQILIKINSDNLNNSMEFGKVLCSALEIELSASKVYLYGNDNSIEIECLLPGPEKECLATIKQFVDSISDTFKIATQRIGGIIVNAECVGNKKSFYKEIDFSTIDNHHKKFLLKFI